MRHCRVQRIPRFVPCRTPLRLRRADAHGHLRTRPLLLAFAGGEDWRYPDGSFPVGGLVCCVRLPGGPSALMVGETAIEWEDFAVACVVDGKFVQSLIDHGTRGAYLLALKSASGASRPVAAVS